MHHDLATYDLNANLSSVVYDEVIVNITLDHPTKSAGPSFQSLCLVELSLEL